MPQKQILDAEPGNYGKARLVLAHKSVATTIRAYSGTENAAALRHYDQFILSKRSAPQSPRKPRGANKRAGDMPRQYDPERTCLKVPLWPDHEQRAWGAALKQGDVFDESKGGGAHWAPLTIEANRKSYRALARLASAATACSTLRRIPSSATDPGQRPGVHR